MTELNEKALSIIAGRGNYPLLLAESARKQGVERISAVAFKRETDKAIEGLVDEVHWIYVGQLQAFLDALKTCGASQAVMAGQINPKNLFNVRMDKPMLALLGGLERKNADTIFGALGDAMGELGIELKPANLFMETCMPGPGVLTKRAPTEQEQADIQFGLEIARASCKMNIGQTVVVKEGTVLAVEAFEGTDQAILRGGQLGGPGAVVIKVAGENHDMRFDIPVIGDRTMRSLKKAKISALAFEAGKSIVLGIDEIAAQADAMGLAMEGIQLGESDG